VYGCENIDGDEEKELMEIKRQQDMYLKLR